MFMSHSAVVNASIAISSVPEIEWQTGIYMWMRFAQSSVIG